MRNQDITNYIIILITYHSPGVLGFRVLVSRLVSGLVSRLLRPLVGRFDWSLLLRDGM